MSEYDELKRVAQVAQSWQGQGTNPYIFDFLAECSPELVLQLITENEKARRSGPTDAARD